MNTHAPVFVVPVVSSERSRKRCLAQMTDRLRKRGLKVRTLCAMDHTLAGDYDILLVSCESKGMRLLPEQMERLWTLAWNQWYARARTTGDEYCRRTVRGARHA